MRKKILGSLLIVATLMAAGCVAPNMNAQNQTIQEQKLTLGTAQKVLRKGLTQSEVVSALGAPNMVVQDKDGLETWVYDKASTSITSAEVSGYGTVLLLGVSGGNSNTTTSQKTLTIIVKFKNSVVSEYSYRSSSF